jgi:GT2 family glycosyltransferase
VHSANHGYASACNAGAAASGAPLLLLLNSDVLPLAPGWLAPLVRALRRRRLAAAAPLLLFEDGSIQHAGLVFARGADGEWANGHRLKGYPGNWPAAQRPGRIPAASGAALLLRRDAFERAGGFCTDYMLGDYEDSDLCLRLAAAGGQIGYAPSARLCHFERQSIARHPGHAGTLANRLNRRLHHARWADAIAALTRA